MVDKTTFEMDVSMIEIINTIMVQIISTTTNNQQTITDSILNCTNMDSNPRDSLCNAREKLNKGVNNSAAVFLKSMSIMMEFMTLMFIQPKFK